MEKAERMLEIADELDSLQSPLSEYRQAQGYKPVIGEGDLEAEIMIIGEAPGQEEAESGRPFVGSAGGVLDDLLASIGLRRSDVYITNLVKDRPPGNRSPRVGEVRLYAPLLMRQIDIIQPQVLVPMGRFATEFVLDQFSPENEGKISDLHGQVLPGQAAYGEVAIVPLYHPAVVFYRPERQEVLEQDIQALKAFVQANDGLKS